jgi:hypothetical protein
VPGGAFRNSVRVKRFSAEDVAWLGLIPAAALTLAAMNWLAPALKGLLDPPGDYHPFPQLRLLFAPEPVEEARFLIAIAAPVVLAALVWILGSDRPGRRRLDPLIIVVQLVALGFVAWALTKTETDLPVFPHVVAVRDFLPRYLVGVWVLAGGIVIGVGLTLLLFLNPQPGQRLRAFSSRLAHIRWLPPLVAMLAGVIWLLPAVVTDSNIGETGFAAAHIPLHFEDYLAVVNGRTPLVNYVAQYASLLPIAVAPVLATFDSSVTAYSLIEVGLSLIAVLCVYAGFVQVTERRWVALGLFIPFLAITFVPWHFEDNGFRMYSGIYYALFPDRLLLPFAVFWLLGRHLRRGTPPLWILYLVAGLAVFNNFDFGACCLVALIAASLARLLGAAPLRARLGDVMLQAAAGLVAATLIVSAVTLLLAGALPNPSVLTFWSRLFGREGLSLLPMPVWGFQWALYFTYAGALLTGVVRLVRRRDDGVLNALLIFVAVFGLTTGQYYAGRSAATQLIALLTIWGLNVALLTWLVAGTLRGVRPARARRYLVPAFAVLAGFGIMIAAVARVQTPWNQIDRIFHGGPHVLDLIPEQRFVAANTSPGETVLLINTSRPLSATGLDHRVAERAGVSNASPFPPTVFFSPSEVSRALDNLDDDGGTKVFERLQAQQSPEAGQFTQILNERGFRLLKTDPVTKLNLWVRGGAS